MVRAMTPRPSIAAALALVATLATSACAGSADPEASVGLDPNRFQIIAHRGASAYAPENTLPAFERAQELGAVDVELDVQLSRDDVLVLYHDKTLDRKTERTGRVRDHDAAELAKIDIGSWFDRTHPDVERDYAGTTLDTLAALFQRFGAALYYHVEIKSDEEEIPALVLTEIAAFSLGERVTITSFSFEQLLRVRALDREIPICLLLRDARGDDPLPEAQRGIELARAARFQQVGVAATVLTSEIVDYAHRRGVRIRAFGVGGDEDMERAIDAGAGGMTINWPDRLIERMRAD
jgi:glycerophosphoryl diester phosphodiesterase